MKTTDYIEIENLQVFAYHGVYPDETKTGQHFYLSAKLYTNLNKAGNSDNLSHSTDYGEICLFMSKLMNKKTFKLIEAAAHYVVTETLLAFSAINAIALKLSKPEAPVNLPFENISVNISRGWHTAYIGLGSNMGDKNAFLENAIKEINNHSFCRVRKVSDFIETKPYGYTKQPNFLNAVAEVSTIFTPYELLEFIQKIELNAGRTRDIHWGPRTLDLDILFYDDYVMEDALLVIPHPEIEKRDFVLVPLKQIAPYKVHPVSNKRMADIPIPQ